MSGPGFWEHNALINFVAEVLSLDDGLDGGVEDFVRKLLEANEILGDHARYCDERQCSRDMNRHLADLYLNQPSKKEPELDSVGEESPKEEPADKGSVEEEAQHGPEDFLP